MERSMKSNIAKASQLAEKELSREILETFTAEIEKNYENLNALFEERQELAQPNSLFRKRCI